ncbi:hypothetical protein F5Y10DRAFT_268248 [Nemania abortiva]|nr:hypothetical protein F5Y10DRAFT_268248 [Nemania abortiva]
MHIASFLVTAGMALTAPVLPFIDNTPNIAPNTTLVETIILASQVIPITEITCMHHLPISQEYSTAAKDAMIEWGENGSKVSQRSHVAKWFPVNSTESVAWIVCNFKYLYSDPVPRKELDQAQLEIELECGRNESGRVYSEKWEKEYIVAPHSWYTQTLSRGQHVCRHRGRFWFDSEQ